MYKKIKLLLATFVLLSLPALVFAAVTDFTANSNITVSGVTFGAGSANMLIFSGSTAQSWLFNSGAFTVTNPGIFQAGSSDSAVKSIQVTSGGTTLVCEANTTPGTSYATLPTASGTYTVLPSATTACTSLCTVLSNTATYNAFPTCGALSCNAGYQVSGSGANATCTVIPVGGVSTALLTCSSGYKFGQNSSGGWSCIPIVSTPITATIAGCMPGYLFSVTTGKSCGATVSPTTATPSTSATQSAGARDGIPSAVFMRNLSFRTSSADVRRLQVLLASDKDVYPEGLTTGYYGALTQKAVGQFQIKYGVVSSSKAPGYGNVGPITRAKLQKVFGN